MTTNHCIFNREQRENIVNTIVNDGVICYPTEAVWGLGCHPRSEKAFRQILTLKQRPEEKGVILIAADLPQITPYAQLSEELLPELMLAWQSFTTCVLPKTADCPNYLCGQHGTIAVRLTQYDVLKTLCLTAKTALVSTSANLNNQRVVENIDEAKQLFAQGVDFYVDAPLGGALRASRIIDFTQRPAVVIRD